MPSSCRSATPATTSPATWSCPLRLPAGITARGGSGSDSWTCTPGATTTCTLDDLNGGDQTTVRVRVDVTAAAVPGGTASGSVRADDAASTPIPAGMLVVLP